MNAADRRIAFAAFAAVAAVVAVSAIALAAPGRADAHQPEGLRISQEPVLDYPCPYGHDSGCEAPSAPPALNPYQGASPDTPISPDIIGNISATDNAGLHAIRNIRTGRWTLPARNKPARVLTTPMIWAMSAPISRRTSPACRGWPMD